MPNDVPQTLPPDFFSKKGSTSPPKTLPPNFFAAKETPDPTKPEPSIGAKQTILKPLTDAAESSKRGFLDLPFSSEGSMRPAFGAAPGEVHRRAQNTMGTMGAIAGGAAFGPQTTTGLPWILRALASSSGAGLGAGGADLLGGAKPREALETSAKVTAGTMAAETTGVAGLKLKSKLFPKIDPLAKINKLLGVEPKDVMPGKTPASLDEFAANPARGARKYGLDEAKLSKMDALERNEKIMQARDKAGKSLDQVLEAASGQGKKVNIQDTINETFSEIADPKLTEQAEKRLIQILDKAGINKPLRDLSPMEARTVQRGLDNFAKFANESEAKSFGDIADQLRSGISKATRKVVPESAEFDRDYTDLVRASNATQKAAKEFATTVPENKLRKLIIKGILAGAAGAAAGAAGYEGVKHWGTPTP